MRQQACEHGIAPQELGGLELRLPAPNSGTAQYAISDTGAGSAQLRALLLSLLLLSVGGCWSKFVTQCLRF